MNTLVTIAFKGTAYAGFQVQKNAPTVCGVFQDALEKTCGARLPVTGCSRTDAGVHALGFCLHISGDISIPPDRLPLALNAHLPPDIRALAARRVPDAFHARYSALGKTYVYRFYNSPIDSPFDADYCWRIPGRLDAAAMARAAGRFAGTHNFSAFMAAGGSVAPENAVRTVYTSVLEKEEGPAGWPGQFYTFRVSADGFLYHMVRIMAGTLAAVGRGALAQEAVDGLFERGIRSEAGMTAPAAGLFLVGVRYPEEEA